MVDQFLWRVIVEGEEGGYRIEDEDGRIVARYRDTEMAATDHAEVLQQLHAIRLIVDAG